MALPFSNQVSAVTQNLLNESVSDAFFTANPLLEHLLAKGSVKKRGGDRIQLPLFTDDTDAAGSYDGYDILDTTPNENINAAVYDWRHEYGHMVISHTEMLKNSGETAKVDLIKAKVKNLMQTLKKNISTRIFSANGDSDLAICGLRQMVKATGAIGNIDQADFSLWASDIDSSTNTLTLALMNQSFLDACVGQDEPDIAVTRKGVWRKYWELLQAQQRFGEGKSVRGGFKYILFNEIPLFWDVNCPGSDSGSNDNHLFFLNSSWLYFYIHEDDNFVTEDIPKVASQNVIQKRVTFTGQLCTDNRRMHSAMTVLNH
jgi:hypothetical protein